MTERSWSAHGVGDVRPEPLDMRPEWAIQGERWQTGQEISTPGPVGSSPCRRADMSRGQRASRVRETWRRLREACRSADAGRCMPAWRARPVRTPRHQRPRRPQPGRGPQVVSRPGTTAGIAALLTGTAARSSGRRRRRLHRGICRHDGGPLARRAVEPGGSVTALAGVQRQAHARRVHTLDLTAAIVLGLLLLAAVLGGLVWLDRGPVGQHGRELKRRPPAEQDEQPPPAI
jgi:hypothetical protein